MALEGLLGKDVRGVNPDALAWYETILNRYQLNYSDPTRLSPFTPVAYHKAEHEFIHPWSLDASGEEYTLNRLSDVISLHDYLTLPAYLLPSLLKGLTKGLDRRLTLEKEAQGGGNDETSKLEKALQKEMDRFNQNQR